MKVLFTNHTALISGAERSLLTLVQGLPPVVRPELACPEGPLADAARDAGLEVATVPGTDGSLKLHPLHTPRAALDLTRATNAVRQTALTEGAELVHANTLRAGLVACAAARLGGPPAVVHAREYLPGGAVSDFTLRAIASGASAVIANSRFTASRFPAGGDRMHVIPSPVDLDRFSEASVDLVAARSRLGLDAGDFVLAVIGQITPWKGQDIAIRALGELSRSHPGMRLLIVGSAKFTSRATRFDNRAYEEELGELVRGLGLEEKVVFVGEREDVPEILVATDLLLVPSWDEPFGRSIVEAMAMGVPVIATAVGGPVEIIRDGVHGLLLPPHRHEPWAAAIRDLAANPGRLKEMGVEGREEAKRYGVDRHVSAVVEVYESVLGRAST